MNPRAEHRRPRRRTVAARKRGRAWHPPYRSFAVPNRAVRPILQAIWCGIRRAGKSTIGVSADHPCIHMARVAAAVAMHGSRKGAEIHLSSVTASRHTGCFGLAHPGSGVQALVLFESECEVDVTAAQKSDRSLYSHSFDADLDEADLYTTRRRVVAVPSKAGESADPQGEPGSGLRQSPITDKNPVGDHEVTDFDIDSEQAARRKYRSQQLVSTSGVRVEVVHEVQGEVTPAAQPFVEVRTKNTAYGFDGGLSCIYVHSLKTNSPLPNHPMLGAKLLGGVKRDNNDCRESTPLPAAGMVAILRRRSVTGYAYAKTSWVTDVCVFVYMRSKSNGNTTLAHIDQNLVDSTATCR